MTEEQLQGIMARSAGEIERLGERSVSVTLEAGQVAQMCDLLGTAATVAVDKSNHALYAAVTPLLLDFTSALIRCGNRRDADEIGIPLKLKQILRLGAALGLLAGGADGQSTRSLATSFSYLLEADLVVRGLDGAAGLILAALPDSDEEVAW